MTKNLILTLFFILSAVNVSNTIADDGGSSSPADVINQFHETLLFIMKNSDTLGYQGRHEKLSADIPGAFNIPLISQVILGRYWTTLDEASKEDFISVYKDLVVATYADRFDSFNGETFHTITTDELNRGRVLVKTELTKTDGETITLDYLMSESENKWMIISVIANGANDISIKRGEYSDVIKNNGFDALLVEIQKKIDEAGN